MRETNFKQTEIGLIPADWEVVIFEDLFRFLSNNTLSRENLSLDGEVLDIHYGDILTNYGNIIDPDRDSIPYIKDRLLSFREFAKDGDIIIADTAEDLMVGKCTEISNLNGKKLVSGLHTIWVRPKDCVQSGYLGYFMNMSLYHNQLLPLIQGVKVSSISKSAIKKTWIALPKDKNEQSKIALSLKEIDSLILDLRKLVDKKRAIKAGGMSNLLSSRVRLPGFTEPWISSTLEEIGTFHKGKGIPRKDSNSGDIPAIRYGEIYTDHNDYIRDFRSHISQEVADDSYKLESGDLCFAASGETLEEIGKTVAFVGDYDAYAGGDIVILRPSKEVDSIFMGFRLNMPDVAIQKSFKGNGVSIMHIQAKGLKDILVTYPSSLDEQSAIAKILTDMDAEIAALEAKLKKYEQLKQGMMQQLLTGKIRLVSPNKSMS